MSQELVINLQNTKNERIIVGVEQHKDQRQITIHFLEDLQDYVKYKPVVLNPMDRVSIKYELKGE